MESRWSREDFCSYVTESVVPRSRGPSRVQAIETGGKWRTISIPPRVDNALRPLHQSMYDRLSKFDWLLRGDAKASRFSGFRRSDGEIFVSGDYESATDNLNGYLQSAIFHQLLGNARSVPDGIRYHALSIFNSLLESDGFTGVQSRGQLMGQLTSFPLLCLVNYLTFKFSIPRDVPVKINGDDIVFRSTEAEKNAWFKNVQRGGLTLSVGKTLVSDTYFSLNSAIFRGVRNGARAIPFLRARAIWSGKERQCERISSLASRFRSFAPGYGFRKRISLNAFFLNENLNTVYRCRRSLTRGMGMKVGRETLHSCGLWFRELFYLEKWSEPELPSFSFAEMRCNNLPVGWKRVSSYRYPKAMVNGWRMRLAHELVKSAWTSDVVDDRTAEERWMVACDTGADKWGIGSMVNAKLARLAKISRRDLWKATYFRRNDDVFGRCRFTRGASVLQPPLDPELQDLSFPTTSLRGTIDFVSGGVV